MIEINLNNYKKVRIWFEENKVLKDKDSLLFSKEYNTEKNIINSNKRIVAEVLIPCGGRIVYGLLGFNYIPDNSNTLKLNINFHKEPGIYSFNDSLMKNIEPIYIGLNQEYLPAIINRIDLFHNERRLLLSGSLNFCYSAYGEVSSSQWIFFKLTNLLLILLVESNEEITKEFIIDTLKTIGII